MVVFELPNSAELIASPRGVLREAPAFEQTQERPGITGHEVAERPLR